MERNYSVKKFHSVCFYRLLFLFFCISMVTVVRAQVAYSCDFEDEAENARWELNYGPSNRLLKNKWFIGTATNNGGEKSLYISSDALGATTDYTCEMGLTTVAYRDLTLPAGDYELSFDWQAVGLPSDGVYVCWIPASVNTPSITNSNLPPYIQQYYLEFDGKKYLNSSSWHTSSVVFTSDGTPHKLLFAWTNGKVAVAPPAGCIDNIYVLPVGRCAKPKNITASLNGNQVVVEWDGNADSFDVKYKLPDAKDWVLQTGVTANKLAIDCEGEGPLYVYVRSKCDDVYTSWTSYDYFVYFPGYRCIDIFDLNDGNCFCGDKANPKAGAGVVDAGYRSRDSRHTIHYDVNETDPRTDGVLKTVPPGEIASVRLGNWNIGGEVESIEYKYHVDASQSAVLLLKYAAVLQDPGHVGDNQPRFTLRILGEDGESLSRECIDADFIAGNTTQGWTQAQSFGEEIVPGMIEGTEPPVWKDWTTVGINLSDYDGQDITISLRTYDCSQTGHYGYAYFTINCSDAKVKGLSCGDMEENIFEAPAGFKYLWYVRGDPNKVPVCTEQRLVTNDPKDSREYACDVISTTNAECYYTIYASVEPRYPRPDMAYTASAVGCQNTVVFEDRSSIILVNPETQDTAYDTQSCDSVLWNFDMDSSDEWVTDENPVHLYPQEGGTFRVGMRAYLAECMEEREFVLNLPNLDYKRDTICAYRMGMDDGIEFGGGVYYEAGLYSDTVPAPDGTCDSISFLSLKVGVDAVVRDTVCTGDFPVEFMDEVYTQEGVYIVLVPNTHGCDSVIEYRLVANESLVLDVAREIDACADDENIEIPFSLSSGLVSSYDVTFADAAVNELMGVTDGKPDDNRLILPITGILKPDRYRATILFKNHSCGDVPVDVTVDVNYPDSIVAQRWNDVLAVRNFNFNGGYDFLSYQWYVNGEPIEGAINPNLYIGGGLDVSAYYTVALTRVDDGVTAFTCPITPTHLADGTYEEIPTVTFHENMASVKSEVAGVLRIYSVAGVLISVHEFYPGEARFVMPSAAGMYLLEAVSDNGARTVERIVVKKN